MLRLAVLAAIVAVGIAVKCDPTCKLDRTGQTPNFFFKFGENTDDFKLDRGKLDNHKVLNGLAKYVYNGREYTSIVISVNGNAVWGSTNYNTWAPWVGQNKDYKVDMMAPYWVRSSNTGPESDVYYRKSTDATLINKFRKAVKAARGNKGTWEPEELIIITWWNLDSYFNPCTPADTTTGTKFGPSTFQLVVGTRNTADENDEDKIQTMAMFNFAKICYSTRDNCMIGFNEKENGYRYWFTGSNTEKGCRDIVNHGNPENSQYVFRIDSKKDPSEHQTCRRPLGWFIRDYDWEKTNFEYDVSFTCTAD